jgi:HAD superfamily hydrolase (TIGR01484 family)
VTPFAEFPATTARRIRFVLTDVDDTLTDGARLPASAYAAIEALSEAGVTVIPVTAAPSGWCDLMCRMWPVGAVIGENGGLCFRHDRESGKTERRYWADTEERLAARAKLMTLGAEVLRLIPGSELAHDQRYRETTLTFRMNDPVRSAKIIAHLDASGARTTANSIWVIGWLGEFDKLAMARRMLGELFGVDIDRDADSCLYVGDSINDAPMFGFFPHSIGVASVRNYAERMPALPRWITEGAGGAGFVEVAEKLLRLSPGKRSGSPRR